MAKLVKKPYPGKPKLNESVLAMPESPYEHTFDSTFIEGRSSTANCTLRITMRLLFRQVSPNQIPAFFGLPVSPTAKEGLYPDSNSKPNFIREWSGAEWSNFINLAKAQAQLWDGKFWLIPPDSFSHFDINTVSMVAKKAGDPRPNPSHQGTIRPNVKCEFRFEVALNQAYAHGTVDVVNLSLPYPFRSHSRLFSSDDTRISPYSTPDSSGMAINTTQPTITHEIGHSLGLPHIGVARNLVQCKLAMVLGAAFHQDRIPALLKGHSNADVCYGTGSAAGDINNIMGSGSTFNTENAKPWLDRLFHHLNLDAREQSRALADFEKWKISTTDTPPMSLVGFR